MSLLEDARLTLHRVIGHDWVKSPDLQWQKCKCGKRERTFASLYVDALIEAGIVKVVTPAVPVPPSPDPQRATLRE